MSLRWHSQEEMHSKRSFSIYTRLFFEGLCSVMVIVAEKGTGKQSSNSRRSFLQFLFTLILLKQAWIYLFFPLSQRCKNRMANCAFFALARQLVKVWRGTPHSQKLQDWSLTIRLFSVLMVTYVGGSFPPPSAETQSMYTTVPVDWAQYPGDARGLGTVDTPFILELVHALIRISRCLIQVCIYSTLLT